MSDNVFADLLHSTWGMAPECASKAADHLTLFSSIGTGLKTMNAAAVLPRSAEQKHGNALTSPQRSARWSAGWTPVPHVATL